jgi:hypothetical protein
MIYHRKREFDQPINKEEDEYDFDSDSIDDE